MNELNEYAEILKSQGYSLNSVSKIIGMIQPPFNQVENEMVTVIGKVFDVGMLDNGRGFKIETNGEEVEVIGLTEQECREIALCLGEKVRITIEPDNAMLRCANAVSIDWS